MINLISNISHIKKISKSSVSKLTFPLPKEQSDEFIKQTDNNDMSESSKLFCSNNKNLDYEALTKTYSEKTKILPLIMDRMMNLVGKYIKREKDAEFFTVNFLDDSSSLAKRISMGDDSEEYCQNYAPELKMIKGINPLCDEYNKGEIQKEKLDNGVENCFVEYVQDNTQRKTNFIK